MWLPLHLTYVVHTFLRAYLYYALMSSHIFHMDYVFVYRGTLNLILHQIGHLFYKKE